MDSDNTRLFVMSTNFATVEHGLGKLISGAELNDAEKDVFDKVSDLIDLTNRGPWSYFSEGNPRGLGTKATLWGPTFYGALIKRGINDAYREEFVGKLCQTLREYGAPALDITGLQEAKDFMKSLAGRTLQELERYESEKGFAA